MRSMPEHQPPIVKSRPGGKARRDGDVKPKGKPKAANAASVRPAKAADKLLKLGLSRDIDLALHLPMRY
jgi:ATP-dependent DNA helicase RecG